MDCENCRVLGPFRYCESCTALKRSGTRKADGNHIRVRRTLAGFRRADLVAQARGREEVRRLRLRCEDGHFWWSEIDPGKDEDPIKDPVCACGKFYNKATRLQAEFSATTKCDKKCWNALHEKCRCSCTGGNHGVGEAEMRIRKATAAAA